MSRPPIIAVSGIKNSGKTTVLIGLIPILKKQGLRVAVIKHDGHDFTPDMPGTDSFRLAEAGAFGVAVYSPRRYMVAAEREDSAPEDFLDNFQDADLVLLEGGKHTAHPKIEVLRGAVSGEPVCDPATLLALATDTDFKMSGVPAVALDDYPEMARLITAAIKANSGGPRF